MEVTSADLYGHAGLQVCLRCRSKHLRSSRGVRWALIVMLKAHGLLLWGTGARWALLALGVVTNCHLGNKRLSLAPLYE